MINEAMLKIIFLCLAVYWTLINFGRLYYKANIPALNFVIQTIGIVGFIVLQFNLI